MQTNLQEKRRIRWVCGNTCLAPSEAREAQGLRRRCAGVSTMVAESIPYTTCYNARNAHLAQNAAKCCKNAGKFFPDVLLLILY